MKGNANALPIIGITSTIPIEVVFAAGYQPLDLNNIFISSQDPEKLVKLAEIAGFSHNICAWIKGIYSVVITNDIKDVIAVTGGDCSNTVALAELFERKGINIISFDYPLTPEREPMRAQIEHLIRALNTTWESVQAAHMRIRSIREKLWQIDRLTYQENVVTGLENHMFLVSSSDFKADLDQFEGELDEFLSHISTREPSQARIRLGYVGVPPIFCDIYSYIESLGARVVYNEVQRQFSMPSHDDDVVAHYVAYTYPYAMEGRIKDIKKAIQERALDGLIHYTQTFCFRQLYDIILRESISIPILTLEGDRPGKLDARTALRIETFCEMLKDR